MKLTEKESMVFGTILVFGFGWPSLISEATGLKKSTVSKILKRLEEKELIKKVRSKPRKIKILSKLPKEYLERLENRSNKSLEQLAEEIKIYRPNFRSFMRENRITLIAMEILS